MKLRSNQELKSPTYVHITGRALHTDPEDLSGATFKIVGATHESENFSFSFISIDLTGDIGIGATRTTIPCDHCYFIVDHC